MELITIRENQIGILLPAFATSLDRVPLPLTQQGALRVGSRIKYVGRWKRERIGDRIEMR